MNIKIIKKEIFDFESVVIDSEPVGNKAVILFKYNKRYYVLVCQENYNLILNINEVLNKSTGFTNLKDAENCFLFYYDLLNEFSYETIDHLNNKDDLDYIRF